MTRITMPRIRNGAAPQYAPRKAFQAYLRYGDRSRLDENPESGNGFPVSLQIVKAMQPLLRNIPSLRSLAEVVTVESASCEVLTDEKGDSADWTVRRDASLIKSGGGAPVDIPLHELSAPVKISQKLLDDPAFDVEAWLARQIAPRFARSEAAAFISGDGVAKPKGILSYPVATAAAAGDGKIGTVTTGSSGEFNPAGPADCLIDLVYSLGAKYRANASFVMSSRTAAEIRKMKDADGRFLWSDSLGAEQPARLLGYPVLICEDMPDIDLGSLSVAFGDFRAAYTVAERPALHVLRDPLGASPDVLFYATKRVGGGVTDLNAVKLLQF